MTPSGDGDEVKYGIEVKISARLAGFVCPREPELVLLELWVVVGFGVEIRAADVDVVVRVLVRPEVVVENWYIVLFAVALDSGVVVEADACVRIVVLVVSEVCLVVEAKVVELALEVVIDVEEVELVMVEVIDAEATVTASSCEVIPLPSGFWEADM